MHEAAHHFDEHTGEVRVHLQAPDLPGLYREAGRALAELMAPGASCEGGEGATIEVEGRDREALLVALVDELIYRVDTTGQVFPALEIEAADGGRLRARIHGCVPREFKTAVKAATFHDLHVEEGAEGFSARLVLDV